MKIGDKIKVTASEQQLLATGLALPAVRAILGSEGFILHSLNIYGWYKINFEEKGCWFLKPEHIEAVEIGESRLEKATRLYGELAELRAQINTFTCEFHLTSFESLKNALANIIAKETIKLCQKTQDK